MPFNGAGMFVRVRNWVADAAAGVKIRADYHDIEDDGFAAGISQCITRDGQSTVTNNIPMNGKRVIALSDPVDPQDSATKAYADTKLPLAGGTITGSLTVNGKVATTGYQVRTGLSGAYGGAWFNFNWTGKLQAWINDTNLGSLATEAYVEDRAQAWANQAAAPKVNRAGDQMTGQLITAVGGNIGVGGQLNSIRVDGAAGDWAAMSFYIPDFGANFGINSSGDFYCGGWSYGAGQAFKFWTQRNLNPILDARLVNMGTTTGEPYAGSVVTGLFTYTSGTLNGAVNAGKFRQLQLLTPGGWYAVGYVG